MTIDLGAITLTSRHRSPDEGWTLMEAVSMFGGEKFSNEPECVSPALRIFGAELNDVFDDDLRQELVWFIPRLPGTAGDGLDVSRGFVALDWLTRVATPAWLRLVPELTRDADLLAQSPPIDDPDFQGAIGDAVQSAERRAIEAWAAVREAVDATSDVAGDAAWSALWGTQCAGSVFLRAMSWAENARRAGQHAAWIAAVNANAECGFYEDAVAAARDALAPTAAAINESAIDLFDRMITGVLPAA